MSNARSQTTRSRIIEAAYELFSEKGFAKTATREIAERAGVAELTLFRHFQSKNNIIQQVLLHYSPAVRIEETLPEIVNLPFEEGFYRLTRILVEHFQKNRKIIRLNVVETVMDPELKETINPIRLKVLNGLLGYFQRSLSQTGEGEIQLVEIVHTYLWSIFSTVVLFDAEKMDLIRTPPQRMCEVLYTVFLQNLRGRLPG